MTNRFPREFLLSELRRVGRELGTIPRMEDFDSRSKVAAVTLAKRFGGWRKALAAAGFDPERAERALQELEMVTELRRVAGLLGHTPSTAEFDLHSDLRSNHLSRRMGGTWAKACIRAGLPPYVAPPPKLPNPSWRKGTRKLTIGKDQLEYFYNVEGLSATAIAARVGSSRSSVLRLMQEYGIPVRRLHYTRPRETEIETRLYTELERRGVTFVRQQVVDGLWVVDAIVPGARLVIECDGEYWHSLPGAADRDRRKDAYLRSRGYKVFRFPEAAILADVAGCVQRIVDALIDRYKDDG